MIVAALSNGNPSDDYTTVKELVSSGTQYILTDYVPNDKTKVVFTGQSGPENSTVFGARMSFGSRAFGLLRGSNKKVLIDVADKRYETSGILELKSAEVSASESVINGVLISTPAGPFTCPVPMMIFCNNNNGKTLGLAKIGLKSLDVLEDGQIIKRYRPAIRKIDGKPGLLETVGNIFLTNEGSGEFTWR